MFSRPGPKGISVPFAVPEVTTPGGEPFRQTDWPNPVLAKTAVYLLAVTPGTSALTLPPAADTTSILRDPLITKYEKQNYHTALKSQAEQVNTNTLLPIPTPPTLVPSPQDWPNPRAYVNRVGITSQAEQESADNLLPFPAPPQPPVIPIDWPNPRGPVPSIDLKSWIVNYTLLFQTAFRQLDWPNPKGPLQFNRSYELSVNPNLIGQDQTYGLGGYPNFDWPNPKGPRNDVGYKSQAEQVNTNTLLPITPAVQPPFNQTDWPIPKGPAHNLRAFDLSTSAEQKLALYTAAFQFPAPLNITARTREWPNPKGYDYSVGLRSWYSEGLQNTLLAPVAGDTTHILRDPLITKFEKPPQLPTAIVSQPVPNTTALLQAVKPVGQPSDQGWGNNPKGIYYYQKEFFPLSIVIEPTPAAPFKAANWPNPVLSVSQSYTLKAQEPVNNLASQLYQAPIPTIWRVPSIFRNWRQDSRVAENTTPLQNPLDLLSAPPSQFPPASYDWPNPRGYKDNVELRTFLNRNVHIIGQDTFYGDPGEVPGFEFPQPRIFRVLTDKDIHKKADIGLFNTIKPVGQYQFPARLDGRPFNERTWLVNNLQTTLNFTPNLLFFSTKTWNWQANPENITFNIPAAQKPWNWQPNSFTETFSFSFQKSWKWLGQTFGANLTVTAANSTWNWAKNTFSLQRFVTLISQSWQWRGNPAVFIGNTITTSVRKLLMLLGVGQ